MCQSFGSILVQLSTLRPRVRHITGRYDGVGTFSVAAGNTLDLATCSPAAGTTAASGGNVLADDLAVGGSAQLQITTPSLAYDADVSGLTSTTDSLAVDSAPEVVVAYEGALDPSPNFERVIATYYTPTISLVDPIAPLYGLVCTLAWPELSKTPAMRRAMRPWPSGGRHHQQAGVLAA